jgi:DNA invertase Pin-like site-specific DNA recombinase
MPERGKDRGEPSQCGGLFQVSIAEYDMKAAELYAQEIDRYCVHRNLNLVELFSDIDYSGYNRSEKRPALKELVRRRGEFSAVVIPKLSRFGRSLKHLAQLTWISTLWRLLPASCCHVRWTSLPATKTRMPFLSVRLAFSATERHAVQRKKPSVTSRHSPLCLERWLTATVKPARAAPLWV